MRISASMRDHAKAYRLATSRGLSQAAANAHAHEIAREKDADRQADAALDEARRLRDRAPAEMFRVGFDRYTTPFDFTSARVIDLSEEPEPRLAIEVYRDAFHGWSRIATVAATPEMDDLQVIGPDRSDDPECFDVHREAEYVLPRLRAKRGL